MRKLIVISLLVFLCSNTYAQKNKWEVDTVFSNVVFDVNHLIFTKVSGEFFGFDGTAYSDSSDFSDIRITFVIYPKSLLTDSEIRDSTLRSEKFLDVEKFKTIVFTSTQLTSDEDGDSKIFGRMTMLGKTNSIDFDLKFLGIKKDTRQRDVADFEVEGIIYPAKWGWHNPPFVSRKVKMHGKIRLIKIGLEY